MTNDFLFIGHRGTRVEYDENTIEAFKKAIDFGANYIEFDVHPTRDNQIIVIHDKTLDRTTNGSGLVKDLLYSEISKVKTVKTNKNIPLLSQIFNEFNETVNYMIELKELGIENEVINIVKKFNLLERCVISSRNLNQLKNLREKFSNIRTCYNITKGIGLTLNEFLSQEVQNLSTHIDFISLNSSLISEKFIKHCLNYNLIPLSWDFLKYDDPLLKIKSLIKIGIKGILFDNYRNIKIIKNWLKNDYKLNLE